MYILILLFFIIGHLFEIDDKLIQSDLSQLINQIEKISSAHDFNQKINDQRVVEICLTRIISAIRFVNNLFKFIQFEIRFLGLKII